MVLGQNHLPRVKDDNSHNMGGAGRRMCLISPITSAGAPAPILIVALIKVGLVTLMHVCIRLAPETRIKLQPHLHVNNTPTWQLHLPR